MDCPRFIFETSATPPIVLVVLTAFIVRSEICFRTWEKGLTTATSRPSNKSIAFDSRSQTTRDKRTLSIFQAVSESHDRKGRQLTTTSSLQITKLPKD